MTTVNLSFAGVFVQVECAHQSCADEISDYYSTHILSGWENRATPDFRLRIDDQVASRYLFRTRPPEYTGSLRGVWYYSVAEGWMPWTDPNPPLFPLWHSPLHNRFTGLHATVVRPYQTALGGIAFVGPSGSGKTTAAIQLTRAGSPFELVCEETTPIYNRTRAVASFVRPFGVHNLERGVKERVAPNPALTQIAPADEVTNVNHVVFLNRVDQDEGDVGILPLNEGAAFRKLSTEHQDLGSTLAEGVATIAGLARNCEAHELSWSTYAELTELVTRFSRE